MRMVTERLAPGVQPGQHTDAGAEQTRVGGHLQQSLGGGPEQQPVEDALIRQRHRMQLSHDGKDHMTVGDGQQLLGARREPAVASRGLTLRTVPVAAGVELDRAVRTRTAALQVTAQGGGPTGADVAQSLALFGSDSVSPLLEQRLFVFANDSGQFKPLVAHLRRPSPSSVRTSRIARSFRGLAVLWSL